MLPTEMIPRPAELRLQLMNLQTHLRLHGLVLTRHVCQDKTTLTLSFYLWADESGRGREREGEEKEKRGRERGRKKETDRQTDRQIETKRQRMVERESETDTNRQTET